MTVDATRFRRVLGRFVTGVTVVTTCDPDGRPAGLTANAFPAVSLTPPLVLVCVDRSSDTHDLIAAAGVFAVNVLTREQEPIARRFAEVDRERRFDGIAWQRAPSGAPLLDGVLAWVDCQVHAAVPGGDHTIYVGQVLRADAGEAEPLLFYRGAYRLEGDRLARES